MTDSSQFCLSWGWKVGAWHQFPPANWEMAPTSRVRLAGGLLVLAEVAFDRGVDRRMEAILAEQLKQAEAPHLVLHRVLQFGETQVDALVGKLVGQVRKGVRGGHVDAGDRRRRDHHAPDPRRRIRNDAHDPVMKRSALG